MNRWVLAVAAAIAAAAVVGSFFLASESASDSDEAAVVDDSNGSGWSLWAADAHGAIVADQRQIRGVRRDGTEVWSMPRSHFDPLYTVCAPRCPAAVLSSDVRNLTSPLAPDPAPVLKGNAHLPKVLRGKSGGKLGIVAVSPQSAVRIGSDREATARWTVTNGTSSRTMPASGAQPDWLPANDGSAALVALEDGRHTYQQPWALRDGVWQPVGDRVKWSGGYGCVSAGARYWINDGTSIKSRRKRVPYDVKGKDSNCAFTSDGVVIMAYTMKFDNGMPSESQTRMALIGLDGTVRSAQTFGDQELRLATDVNSEDFVLTGGGKALVFDGHGRVVDTIPHVASAMFDEEGDLVTVDSEGEVTWRQM